MFKIDSWLSLFVAVMVTAVYTLVIGTFIVTTREDRENVLNKIKAKIGKIA